MLLWDDVPGFLFRSIPVFSFRSPELFFASRGCMRRISRAEAACVYAPVVRPRRQIDRVILCLDHSGLMRMPVRSAAVRHASVQS